MTDQDAALVALTDDAIVAIRDELLPSQGEPFDCIAFARAILAAEAKRGERATTGGTNGTLIAKLRSTLSDKDNMPRMKQEKWLPVGLALEAAAALAAMQARIAELERKYCDQRDLDDDRDAAKYLAAIDAAPAAPRGKP